jgi:hypothetical protein
MRLRAFVCQTRSARRFYGNRELTRRHHSLAAERGPKLMGDFEQLEREAEHGPVRAPHETVGEGFRLLERGDASRRRHQSLRKRDAALEVDRRERGAARLGLSALGGVERAISPAREHCLLGGVLLRGRRARRPERASPVRR